MDCAANGPNGELAARCALTVVSRRSTIMRTSALHAGTARKARALGDDNAVALSGREAGYHAFLMLRVAFAAAPIAFGLDKFFNVLVEWPLYLAPWINDVMPGTGQEFMYLIGGVEILAGVLVAIKPRYGAPLVAAWLAGIIVNLLTVPGFYDVALRDFGLLLGALTLARLAFAYDLPLHRGGS
jgi:DoxX